MKKTGIALLSIVLVISVCSAVSAKDDKVQPFIDGFMAGLIRGDVDKCFSLLEQRKQVPEARQGLEQLSKMLYQKKIDSYRVMSANSGFMRIGGETTNTYALGIEYTIEKNYFLVETVVKEKNGICTMDRFFMVPISFPADKMNRFHLRGKGMAQYLFLFFMVAIPVFIVVSLVFMFRSDYKRKWLWFLAMIFAVVKLTMNWETGELDFQIFFVQLLGAGFIKSPIYAPYRMFIALPVGAVAFWVTKYKSLKKNRSGGDTGSV